MNNVEPVRPSQVGFRIKQFVKACGFGRTKYHSLPDHQKPKSVRIGRTVVIIESPQEYLRRLAEIQAQERKAA